MSLTNHASQRLGWMDILRGLLIISVVIGHSTGIFNRYIYQFHMGAFFVVSGYMSRPERRSVLHTVYHRFLTTYLPVLSATVVLILLSAVMKHTGIYEIFLGDMEYLGVWRTIRELVCNSNLFVWWLGAAWFMLVLFGAAVCNRVLLRLCADRYNAFYALVSVLLYFLGYEFSELRITRNYLDLVLIAQFYFMAGTMLRQSGVPKPEADRFWVDLAGTALFGFTVWYVADRFGFRVDYPDRSFNTPVIDALIAINGGLFCYFLAKVLSRNVILDKLLQAIGRNTMPIVLFHFMSFNVGFVFLYAVGIVPVEYLQNFTPAGVVGAAWWPLFTIVGIGCSILLWKLLMCIPLVPFFFGQDKQTYDRIWTWVCARLSSTVKVCSKWISEGITAKSCVAIKKSFSSGVAMILCCVLIGVVLCHAHIKKIEINTVGSSLDTCVIQSGIFSDGWCETNAVVTIQTGDQGMIHLEGWYGMPLNGGEEIVIFANGLELARYPLGGDTIAFDIPAPQNSQVTLTIQCNFSYPPTPPDTRMLAFIISALDAT